MANRDLRYSPTFTKLIQGKILEALKICLPNCASVGLDELKKMAEWLEEEIFTDVTNDVDYLYKIKLKIESMKERFQATAAAQVGNRGQPQIPLLNLQPQAPHQLLSQNVQNTIANTGVQSPASLPSALPSVTTAAAAGQSTNMQPGIAQNSVGNLVSQGVPSNIFSNTQRQMQGRQQSQQIAPQLQQQPSQNQKQKQKQKKQKLQHETMKQKLQRNMQQNQLLGQQNSIPDMQQPQQRLLRQQNNMSNMQQQHSLSQQNNISNLHQQQLGPQNSAGAQSSASFPPALPSMTSLTQTSVPNAADQRINMQSGIEQNFVDQGLPSIFFSNTQLQIQLLQFSPMVQRQLLKSPLMNPQYFSLDPNAQTEENAVEEIYQRIQSMKQSYLLTLNKIYRKISEECQQLKRNVSGLNVPQGEKQTLLDMLNWHIRCLNVSKNSIVPAMNEMFIAYEMECTISGLNVPEYDKDNLIRLFEDQIIHFPISNMVPGLRKALSISENHIKHVINSNCLEKPVSTELQIQQPGGHPLSTQPRQPQQQQQQEDEVDNQPDATHEIIIVIDSSD